MDSKELSSISNCFGDKKSIKTPKLNTIWLEMIARVLNMPIELKGNKYYSKVFKRVNYKLWNSTFWVVITSSKNKESNKTNGTQFRARMRENRAKQCNVFIKWDCLVEPVEPVPKWFNWLRKILKLYQQKKWHSILSPDEGVPAETMQHVPCRKPNPSHPILLKLRPRSSLINQQYNPPELKKPNWKFDHTDIYIRPPKSPETKLKFHSPEASHL